MPYGSHALHSMPTTHIQMSSTAASFFGTPRATPLVRFITVVWRPLLSTPIGVFLDNAQGLIDVPEPTDESLLKRFRLTVNDALATGLTSIHDAGFNPTSLAFFERYVTSPRKCSIPYGA